MSSIALEEGLPRVLLVNADRFEKHSPTGLTLSGLFSSWPKNKYLQIYLNEMGMESPSERTISAKQAYPLSCLLRSERANLKNERNKATLRGYSMKESLVGRFKRVIRRSIIIMEDVSPFWSSRFDWGELEAFSPDVIYTVGGSVRAMKLAVLCSERFDIPIVIHFMDDWPNTLQMRKGVHEAINRHFLLYWLRRCFERSTGGGLGISPFMADEYRDKYGIPFSWAGCIADQSFAIRKFDKSGYSAQAFVYAGGLHLGRWESLLDVERALSEIAPEFHLEIYTSAESREMYESYFHPSTIFHDAVDRENLPDIYALAAGLVYVESFENNYYEAYCRLSISTKLPECLMSSTPLLFYGPESLGVFELLREHGIAATASTQKQLESAILDVVHGRINVSAAQRFAREHFGLDANLERMARVFFGSIDRWDDER